MKNALKLGALVSLIAALSFTNLNAQSVTGYLEERTALIAGKATPQFELFVQQNVHQNAGWFFLSITTSDWAQGYVGATYSPTKWLQGGAGLGLETDDDPTRFGSYVLLTPGRLTFLGIYENGGSGAWHRAVLNVRTGRASWGLMKEHLVGLGPRVDFKIGRLTLWDALLRSNGENTNLVALNLSF